MLHKFIKSGQSSSACLINRVGEAQKNFATRADGEVFCLKNLKSEAFRTAVGFAESL